MDPFVFDQRFARFVGQMDSRSVSRGTELYEAGGARVDQVSGEWIEGSVAEGRDGPYRARLQFNEDGGMSGSCSCPAFFNCAHSYALARAARERIVDRRMGGERGDAAGARVKARDAAGRSSDATAIWAERLSGPATPEQEAAMERLARAWRLARQSDFLLYGRDVEGLIEDRAALRRWGREPLRELKRRLADERPAGEVAFADCVYSYFCAKGISVSEGLESLARRRGTDGMAARPAKPVWDRPDLKLRVRLELAEMEESGWVQARARYEIAGGGFSEGETEALLRRAGEWIEIQGKGWFRLDPTLEGEELACLRTLGLDPSRGNAQRAHLLQLEELAPEQMVEAAAWKRFKAQAGSLRRSLEPAAAPRRLAGTLRPYQLEGFRFLCQLDQLGLGGILADDMGLGKTLQTLAWLVWKAERKPAGERLRALVVCPKSVCGNWLSEPDKFGTGLRAEAFSPEILGTERFLTANIVVANYAQLRLFAKQLQAEAWDVAALDEAQHIKTPGSQTTRAAWGLKADCRVALSGTPVENRLTDLWSLMRFAMPRLLGPLASFQANYERGKGEDAIIELKKRIRPFLLRRVKQEVAKDLPDRVEEDRYCALELFQRRLYDEQLEEARACLRNMARGAAGARPINALQALLRLRQVCCDPRLLSDGRATRAGAESAKMEALLDIVEPLVEEGHKVLVFSQFTRMLELIGETLTRSGIAHRSLTGKTRRRAEMVEAFQGGAGAEVFLLSLKAAGSGLNLTAASYVVLFDPWWNPAVENQAIDRAHRIGQANKVIAYRILAKDTIEEKIRRLQSEKQALSEAIFGEGLGEARLDWDQIEALLD